MNQIIPSTEPFFIPGSKDAGILLVHGFTGTPKEMRWMGEYLNQNGFTVLGPRLTGHATHPEDMIRSNYTDWLASVEDGYRLLSGAVKRIYFAGLSMGGVLSLTTAAYLPVKGVVAMSTPAYLPHDWRIHVINALAMVQPYLPKSDEAPDAGWFDKEAFKDHISYPRNPVRSIGQLDKLMVVMHAALPKIDVPVLLIHSKDDDYVVKDSMQWICDRLGTEDKKMMWIEGSGHVITRDAKREQVFKAALDFFQRLERGG